LRLLLIALTAAFAVWLPRAPAASSVAISSPDAGFEAGQAILPLSPGRYGSIQHIRTPLPARTIALTFDDGPSPLYNGRVLDVLDERGIKATFFFVGQYARAHPEQVREVVHRGHNVASHSWSHPTSFRYWTREAQITEVRRSYAATRITLNAMESNPGGVLILHETRPQMIEALPGLLDALTARGFTFVQITAGLDGRARALAAEDAVLSLR